VGKIEAGQVYVDTDTRMGGRRLTVVGINKQTKTKGRFKSGHYYVTCKTEKGTVKVDEARLLSYCYRLVSEAASSCENLTAETPCPNKGTSESCACPSAETSAAEFVAEP